MILSRGITKCLRSFTNISRISSPFTFVNWYQSDRWSQDDRHTTNVPIVTWSYSIAYLKDGDNGMCVYGRCRRYILPNNSSNAWLSPWYTLRIRIGLWTSCDRWPSFVNDTFAVHIQRGKQKKNKSWRNRVILESRSPPFYVNQS